MKKNKLITIVLIIVALIAIIGGIILLRKNIALKRERISIIDATYKCSGMSEKIYEDDKYIYSFPCRKSSSVFVKFPNNTKLLVTTALEEGKVTIEELIKAGLDVDKKEK